MESVPEGLALPGLWIRTFAFDVLEELSLGMAYGAADSFFGGAAAMNGAVVEGNHGR